jgi:uncharacterized delta-60 repeat protein
MFTPFAFIQPITTVTPITPTSVNYLLIGGQFTTYNTPTVSRIAQIDSTGSLDSLFNMGAGFTGGNVFDIKQQPDGKYVILGGFTSYSGSAQNRITRLNQNGTRDTTFNVGAGFTGTTYGTAIFPDNSNVIVGNFTQYSGSSTINGLPINGILKLTPSGTIDTTFNVGFGIGTQVGYDAITQSDGKIIIAGTFINYSESTSYIARTDSSGSYNSGPGSNFNFGTGFNSIVLTFVTQSDNKIVAGGDFTRYSDSTTNTTRIVRINSNGSQDTTFVSGLGFNGSVANIKIQSDGKILAIGSFTSYSGSSTPGIVRINTNGTRDTSFNMGAGLQLATNGIDALIQPDGKILVGGSFTGYSGSTVNYLVRINSDGTRDSSLNVGGGFNSTVNSISLQSDNKIIVSGQFTTYSGSTAPYLIRLNSDGTRDNTFNISNGPSSPVTKNAIESSTGKIIIMGNFTLYSGSSTNTTRLMRINPNGSQDTTFITGTGLSSATTSPAHLSVESDGKTYVGGLFATYSGSTVNSFIRLNPSGSIDTTFPLTTPSRGPGFDSAIRSLFISSSNIYFIGDFQAYRPIGRILRLNTDGTIDTSFSPGIGFDNSPYSLTLQPDGKIIAAGTFSTYSGSARANIARLNSNGTRDTSFTPPSFGNFAVSTDLQSDGKILVGGVFLTPTRYIIRLNADGTRDTTFNVGTGIDNVFGSPKSMRILSSPDGKVYFTSVNTTTYSGSYTGAIMRINSSGTLDTTFATTSSLYPINMGGLTGVSSGGGHTLVLSGSSVIVGGAFTQYKEANLNRGIMIDSTGALSSSFNIGVNTAAGLGFNSTVQSWVTQSDGKILVGGQFTFYSGSTQNRIIRLNRNGTIDTSFNSGTGFNSFIFDLRVQSDNKIIAVGAFTTYSGSSVSGIARLNISGTLDNTFNVGTGFTLSAQANHLKIQPDGKIVVVGVFTTYSGSTANRIVRINTDGTRDTTFNTGVGFNQNMEAVILQSDGKIIATGNFTSYSGSSLNRIVRINTDGTRDTTFNLGTGLANSGYGLALQNDGKIVCTSLSQTYSGSTNRFIIRINTNGTLDNTFNANAITGLATLSSTPNSLAINNDGKIYWGNSFSTFSGSFAPNRIVRLNTNGSVDETFNQAFPNFANNTGKGGNFAVHAILLL